MFGRHIQEKPDKPDIATTIDVYILYVYATTNLNESRGSYTTVFTWMIKHQFLTINKRDKQARKLPVYTRTLDQNKNQTLSI